MNTLQKRNSGSAVVPGLKLAPSRTPPRSAAFTMLEVMMAVLIQLSAFISIFACLNYGIWTTRMNRENVRATQIMLDKMEGARLYQWPQLTNSAFLVPSFTNWSYETSSIGMANASGGGIQYTGLVSVVTPIPNMTNKTYSSNLAQVTVTVGWTSSGGQTNIPHIRSMSTYFSQIGLGSSIRLN